MNDNFWTKRRSSYWWRFCLFTGRNFRLVIVIWLGLLLLAGFVYSRVIQKEGFPQLSFPANIVQVAYPGATVDQVDQEISQPLSRILDDLEIVASHQLTATDSQLYGFISLDQAIDPIAGQATIVEALEEADWPAVSRFKVEALKTGSFLSQYDLLVAFFDPSQIADLSTVEVDSQVLADELDQIEGAQAEVINLFQDCQSCPTGKNQISFNQVGLKIDNQFNFYQAALIGLSRSSDETVKLDNLGLTAEVQRVLDDKNQSDETYQRQIVADISESTNQQINSLFINLVLGLTILVLVNYLLISWRAALLTGIFMVSVLLISVYGLYALGLSLNTVTLFSLLLVLGLFVDDATIIVEALERRKNLAWRARLKLGLEQIIKPSWTGSLTTILAFLPLLFVSGIIGQVVILLPITVILSLLISFILSISLIPALAGFLNKGNLSLADSLDKINPLPKILLKAGQAAAYLPRQLTIASRRAFGQKLLLASLIFAFLVVFAGFSLVGRIEFNFFPNNSDSDFIAYDIRYPDNYSLEKAEDLTEEIQAVLLDVWTAENIEKIQYGGFGQSTSLANNRQAQASVSLTNRRQRQVSAPDLVVLGQQAVDRQVDLTGGRFRVYQIDAGPSRAEFPLTVYVAADRPRSLELLKLIEQDLKTVNLKTATGQDFLVSESRLSLTPEIKRRDGLQVLALDLRFDNQETTAVVVATEDYLKAKYDSTNLAAAGFFDQEIIFYSGQEEDSAAAFSSLTFIFPLAILLIYLLVVFEFRSFVKPFLVLVALPFALSGAFFFLYLFKLPLSFFAMLGIIGLVGVVVNNTILLLAAIDFQRRAGASPSQAVAAATASRFRPLITTSLTTILALLPLAINEPLWQALAGVMIAGLISSTLLVLITFPAVYLASGYLYRQFLLPKLRWLAQEFKKQN